MIPEAGKRNTLMTFESPVVTSDGYGGHIVSFWQAIATAWGQLRTLSSFERMQAMRLQVEATHEITLPWASELSGVTPQIRVNVNGRVMNILSAIDTDELHEELVILAQEGVPT